MFIMKNIAQLAEKFVAHKNWSIATLGTYAAGDSRFFLRLRCSEAREPFTLVNPDIVRSSEDRRVYEEGCLSFPDLLVEVERPREVEVRYWNVEGKECFVKASGLLSVCLQHEIDHLEGRTIVASLSRLKRSMVMRKFAKQAQQGR